MPYPHFRNSRVQRFFHDFVPSELGEPGAFGARLRLRSPQGETADIRMSIAPGRLHRYQLSHGPKGRGKEIQGWGDLLPLPESERGSTTPRAREGRGEP